MKAKIRKIITVVEETLTEAGRAVNPPTRRAAAIAVIANPFAGRYQEDLSELIDVGEELGGLLAERAVESARHRSDQDRKLRQGGRRSVRTASWSMPRRSYTRNSARPSARCWARVPP